MKRVLVLFALLTTLAVAAPAPQDIRTTLTVQQVVVQGGKESYQPADGPIKRGTLLEYRLIVRNASSEALGPGALALELPWPRDLELLGVTTVSSPYRVSLSYSADGARYSTTKPKVVKFVRLRVQQRVDAGTTLVVRFRARAL
ncbi:hypothetical protein HNR42_000885 [Deinobacterium chartae]|uniref:Uncharacterized protein n=1 Tax=Deinobacterium chartae TaxID=521158 RepID=A0A841HZN3_9DEIO|nr:hypothetical protein [Deinobacterium chartae]MBB6097468.1 hypothetical protein [Deinobacterium chartae]